MAPDAPSASRSPVGPRPWRALSTSTASNASQPTVWPIDWKPVCMPVSPLATTLMRASTRTMSSSANNPSLLAIRTFLRLSPYPAETCTISLPAARAASSIRSTNATLSALAISSGYRRIRLTVRGSDGASAIVRVRPSPRLAAAAAANAASVRPDSLRSLVWANPVVSPLITRIPAPRSRPEVTCSIRPSSSPTEVLRLSSA